MYVHDSIVCPHKCPHCTAIAHASYSETIVHYFDNYKNGGNLYLKCRKTRECWVGCPRNFSASDLFIQTHMLWKELHHLFIPTCFVETCYSPTLCIVSCAWSKLNVSWKPSKHRNTVRWLLRHPWKWLSSFLQPLMWVAMQCELINMVRFVEVWSLQAAKTLLSNYTTITDILQRNTEQQKCTYVDIWQWIPSSSSSYSLWRKGRIRIRKN